MGKKYEDLVVVVRCKDCKYCEPIPYAITLKWCSRIEHSMDLNGFCNYGERREG